jgi:hypothetical protein
MSREWYRFFLSLFQQVETDSTLVVPDFTVDPSAYTAALTEAGQRTLAEEVGVSPPPLPPPPRYYGAFFDTTTQAAAVINTAYAVTFNNTRSAFGVRRGSPTSEIVFDSPGVYTVQARAQVDKPSASSALMFLWGRHNGVSIANSATIHQVHNNTAEIGATADFTLVVAAGDRFELMWSVDDTAIVLQASAAAAPVPAVPSVVLTVVLVA